MFTGIVETTAPLRAVEERAGGRTLTLDLGELAAGVAVGDSVALDGCCLTVAGLSGGEARFDVVPETLARTQIGDRRPGDLLNVERSLRWGDRLGGHLVLGHVDAVGEVGALEREGDQVRLTVRAPAEILDRSVPKGSIAVSGVSLTIAALLPDAFEVALVPHTLRVTNLGRLDVGDRVNLEADVLGKWVERLLARGRIDPPTSLWELGGASGS